jgi:hypothetical protein
MQLQLGLSNMCFNNLRKVKNDFGSRMNHFPQSTVLSAIRQFKVKLFES